jgi:hypothetical protein
MSEMKSYAIEKPYLM